MCLKAPRVGSSIHRVVQGLVSPGAEQSSPGLFGDHEGRGREGPLQAKRLRAGSEVPTSRPACSTIASLARSLQWKMRSSSTRAKLHDYCGARSSRRLTAIGIRRFCPDPSLVKGRHGAIGSQRPSEAGDGTPWLLRATFHNGEAGVQKPSCT